MKTLAKMQFYICHLQLSSLASIASKKCPSQHFKTFATSFDGLFTGTMLYSSSALVVLKIQIVFVFSIAKAATDPQSNAASLFLSHKSVKHISRI